ncbi:hypothetical protein FEDK69T_30030 [Flavobacterium enshiense DK69]|uniref:DUF4935 domain-containing protein n=1 Tax=Flavobacterium enshiense DK69 TaxID=1107311 RepID=V6S253_9FLAO|nr:hypothetical protein [Flavobacterium enshiense]ESU20479.1 hypothetical protein FEDK69T_30030 [Flavobacterium enshiense DK69]KGO95718.1 hypothetical protein Q767_08460 [Flavobacterium enshiense DK69]
MPIIHLDSNIYRQLGLKFKENIDYKNLTTLLEGSGSEFGLLEVVLEELMDYYKIDIFGSILTDHEKLFKRYQANPYLDDIEIPDTSTPLNKAVEKIKTDLTEGKNFSEIPLVHPNLLLDFLLQNKRFGKKDNTRDFLIFYTLVSLCKKNKSDYFVLISQDEIFINNDFFKKIITKDKITNLKIYQSISEFIKDFGPKLDFITQDLLLESIHLGEIEKELMNDIKCFPSYVSQFYSEKEGKEIPDIESLKIGKIEVHDFYVFKNYDTNTLTLNLSLKVNIKAIYQPEIKKDKLDEYLSSLDYNPYSRHKNNFDKDGRAIFEGNVLFIFEGIVDEKNNLINQLSFVDFIPDYFTVEELKKQIADKQLVILENNTCQHELDTENGFWKNSKYGGGLSWHYKCKKCGIEFDTGDYYD